MAVTVVPLRLALNMPPLHIATHDDDQVIGRELRQHGHWEPFETEVVVRHLRLGDIVIDVGANLGYYSIIAGSIVGRRGQVYSFEPEPRSRSLLTLNVGLNALNNVIIHAGAVGARVGKAFLEVNARNHGDHRIRATPIGTTSQEELIPVDVLDLDSFIDVAGIAPDLIKIDSQGCEVNVLKGLDRFLRHHTSPLTIFLEVWPFGLLGVGSDPLEMVHILEGLKAEMHIIDERSHRLLGISLQQMRSLATNRAFREGKQWINLLISLSPLK